MTLVVTPEDIVGRAEESGAPGLLAKAQHWQRVPLGDVAKVVNGAPFSSRLFNNTGRGLPLVRIRDVARGTTDTFYDGPYDDVHLVRAGDLLVGMDGDFRVAVWRSSNALLNQRVCRIEVTRPDIYDAAFMRHVLQGYLDAIWAETSAVTVKHLSSKTLSRIPLPLPPLDEQQRVVAVLEDHLSRLDVAAASLTRAETLSRALRLTLANDVSAGWVVAPELRGQVTSEGYPRLGPGWTWRSIEEIAGGVRANVTIGPFGSNLKVSDYKESGTPLVFVRNIRSKDFLYSGQPHVSAEKAATLANHLAVKGDVLVTKMGDPPGDSAVYTLDEPAVITSDCLRLRPTSDFLPEYLAIAIESSLVRSQILAITSGVAQKKVSLERFREGVLVPCPDISLQGEMVERFDTVVEATRRLIQGAQQLERVDALRRALLTSAFSGSLKASV